MSEVEVCVRNTAGTLGVLMDESLVVTAECKDPPNTACNTACDNEVQKETTNSEIAIDLFTHTKVDGLPTAEPSSLAMETLLRMMSINSRIMQQLKPCEASYLVIKKKIYTGSLSVVQALKNLVGLNINKDLDSRQTALVRFITICLENQTQFCLLYHRWFDQIQEWRKATAQYRGARLFRHLFLESKTQRILRNRLEVHGFQDLTSDIILGVLIRDLHAISLALGNK